MDIFFQDPDAIPLPPDEVRIKTLRAEPWSDNRRVRVFLEITAFQKRPSGEVIILDTNGDVAASISIIETIMPSMEFTLHLRGMIVPGEYRLVAEIFYLSEPEKPDIPIEDRQKIVVDQSTIIFSILSNL